MPCTSTSRTWHTQCIVFDFLSFYTSPMLPIHMMHAASRDMLSRSSVHRVIKCYLTMKEYPQRFQLCVGTSYRYLASTGESFGLSRNKEIKKTPGCLKIHDMRFPEMAQPCSFSRYLVINFNIQMAI